MPELRAVLVGAGNRGADAYAPYALRHPKELRIVGVADPVPERRMRVARLHGVPAPFQHADWQEALTRSDRADAAIVATGDLLHYEPAMRALELGCHVLLEKPMASTEQECRSLVETAERSGRVLLVCHELRWTAFYQAVADIVRSGRLGRILLVNHAVNLSYWEYAHGYVRGNWSSSRTSTPMILAKACHDFDLLSWLVGSRPRRIESLAREPALAPSNRPAGAPDRCTDGCPHAKDCQYHAPDTYLAGIHPSREVLFGPKPLLRSFARLAQTHPRLVRALFPPARGRVPYRGWPVSAITEDLSDAGIERALRGGPYGRCVYACDNDQPACQLSTVEFEGGTLASLAMQGHAHKDSRLTSVSGTRGNLVARFSVADMHIEVYDQPGGRVERVDFPFRVEMHGGGDERLMAGFVRAARGEAAAPVSPRESLEGHLMAFAANRSAREGRPVDLQG